MRFTLIALLFAFMFVSLQPVMAAFPVKSMSHKPGLKEATDRIAGLSYPGSQPAEPAKRTPWFGIGSLLSDIAGFGIFNGAMISMANENIPHVAPGINSGLVMVALCFTLGAIVLGVLGMKRKRKLKGLAIAGFILGILVSFVILKVMS